MSQDPQFSAAHALLSAVPQPALLVTGSERIIGANAKAEALLGGGLSGRHLITVIRQPSVLEAIERCDLNRSTQEARYLGRDVQNELTYKVNCGFVDLRDVQGVLVSFEDISQAEAIGQMRRDFVANVSHELRTPLTALIGFIETLQGPAAEDAKARDRFLSIMGDEASRMNRLVSDLLSLSQVEAEARLRPSQNVDLGHLLAETVEGLSPVADAANVTVDWHLPDQPVTVPGDSDQLRQIFTNLIENAIKYGGRDNTVTLQLSESPRDPVLRQAGVRVDVIDRGPGIEAVHLPRLTERFYRIDSHRSREMGGTGLGLAIVKHIVNRHRGRFKIQSTPGEGSTFSVLLPMEG
ncbi:MAG: ATP-binding protein [Pseudomonadota bacterium]|nr:ATP-binding protein [Pseudomonadota bacterium]